MQNKHYFFPFLGIPTYGEGGGGGSSRLGQIPNFYRNFVLKAPLKVISAGNTWFPRSVAGKGTDRCAADYEAKLRRYDVQFHGAGRGRQGFVILGAWKRVSWWRGLSHHFHKLLLAFAESRVAAMSRTNVQPQTFNTRMSVSPSSSTQMYKSTKFEQCNDAVYFGPWLPKYENYYSVNGGEANEVVLHCITMHDIAWSSTDNRNNG